MKKNDVVRVRGSDRHYKIISKRLDNYLLEPIKLSHQELSFGYSLSDRRIKFYEFELIA